MSDSLASALSWVELLASAGMIAAIWFAPRRESLVSRVTSGSVFYLPFFLVITGIKLFEKLSMRESWTYDDQWGIIFVFISGMTLAFLIVDSVKWTEDRRKRLVLGIDHVR